MTEPLRVHYLNPDSFVYNFSLVLYCKFRSYKNTPASNQQFKTDYLPWVHTLKSKKLQT